MKYYQPIKFKIKKEAMSFEYQLKNNRILRKKILDDFII